MAKIFFDKSARCIYSVEGGDCLLDLSTAELLEDEFSFVEKLVEAYNNQLEGEIISTQRC